ncbi:unnamed protein product, partial [marine sediment metagenome]
MKGIKGKGKDVLNITHKFYWEGRTINRLKPPHPGENDGFIPASIRG